MAFTQGTTEEFKLYTGVADCSVVAINPTEEKLEKLGKPSRTPLKYIEEHKDEAGNTFKRANIDIWLQHKNPDILVKIRFFLENRVKTTIDGSKKRYINDFGQNFYGASSEDIPVNSEGKRWIENVGVKECYVGEAELVDFIRKWFGAGSKDVSKFDNIKALFDGDFSELSKYAKEGAAKKVQVLLYVNTLGYQTVFTRHFAPAFNKRPDGWMRSLTDAKINHQGTLLLKEYDPMSETSLPPTVDSTEEDPFK